MQSHARRFRTVNLVCDPLLDRLQLALALVLVILILVRGHSFTFLCLRSWRILASAESHPGTVDEQQIARNVQALKNRLRGRGGARAAGRGRVRAEPGSGRDSHPNSEYDPLDYVFSPC